MNNQLELLGLAKLNIFVTRTQCFIYDYLFICYDFIGSISEIKIKFFK